MKTQLRKSLFVSGFSLGLALLVSACNGGPQGGGPGSGTVGGGHGQGQTPTPGQGGGDSKPGNGGSTCASIQSLPKLDTRTLLVVQSECGTRDREKCLSTIARELGKQGQKFLHAEAVLDAYDLWLNRGAPAD